ncbi:hypothetical protein RRG08_017409 [Elysia crispata]|uniref:acid phosphatase n=1 Tax=Elysia crispata TaxID=231223 RepID=A0AAE1DK69_9GAST|nr:hypothetical protein RRG08_017409 [Elysia crispata]
MNMWASVLVFTSLVVSGCLGTPPSSLRLVSILYRHGDRAPTEIYPKDNNQEDKWPNGIGRLTNMGKQEQYELGQYVKARYDGFISTSHYDQNEISIESSSMPRCLDSAYTHLAGLFPPQGDQIWKDDLLWQPIPVQTRPMEEDNKLALRKPCPRYEELFKKMEQKPHFQEEQKRNKKFYDMVRENTGITNKKWTQFVHVADTLICERIHNMTWNDWAYADGVFEKLNNIRLSFFDLFVNTSAMARLQGGPLLKEMLENMQAATKTEKPMPKFYMYSAHDTTVAALLKALHAKERNQLIIYRALVMVELHETNSEFEVKIFYRNDTSADPYPLTPEGCSQPCTLSKLIEITKDTVPKDWDKECKAKFDGSRELPPASWIAFGIAIAFIISSVVICIVWRLRFSNRREKSYSSLPA